MGFLIRILTLILSNGIALALAAKLIDGVTFNATWQNILIAGALLGFFNAFLRPLLKLFSFPLIILTLGIFTVIINLFLLLLVDYFLISFNIQGLSASLWCLLIVSLVNYIISSLIKD